MNYSENDAGRFDRFRSLALDENIPGMAEMLGAGFDVNSTNGAHESAFMHCVTGYAGVVREPRSTQPD